MSTCTLNRSALSESLKLLSLHIPSLESPSTNIEHEISKIYISVISQMCFVKLPYSNLQKHTQTTHRTNRSSTSDENGRNTYILLRKSGIYQYALNNTVKLSFVINNNTISVYITITDAQKPFKYELCTLDLESKHISDHVHFDEYIDTKLASFIHSMNKDINAQTLRQCFHDNQIDSMYFMNHKRNDFRHLMKKHCDLNTAKAMRLWKHFVIDLNESIANINASNVYFGDEYDIYNDIDNALTHDIQCKLLFIHAIRDDMDLNLIRRCFIRNYIDFEYFRKHKRKDFVMLMRRECGLKYGLGLKLWNHFVESPSPNTIVFNFKSAPSMFNCSVVMETTAACDDGNNMVLDELKRLEFEIEFHKQKLESLSSILEAIESDIDALKDEDDDTGNYIDLQYGESLSTPWD